MTTRLKHQEQDCELTLQEGIDEYYKANPHLLQPGTLKDDGAYFFKCHDRIHVVFGLDTSFLQEMKADSWTAFGTDLGIVGYIKAANNSGIKKLVKDTLALPKEEQARFKKEIKEAGFSSLVAPVKVYLKVRKMTRKWPWAKSEALLHRTLKDIRSEFNIEIF